MGMGYVYRYKFISKIMTRADRWLLSLILVFCPHFMAIIIIFIKVMVMISLL